MQISYRDYAYKGQFLSKQIELPPALLPHKGSIALHTTVNLTLSYKMALVYIINDKKNGGIRQDTNLLLQLVELFSDTLAVIRIVPDTFI